MIVKAFASWSILTNVVLALLLNMEASADIGCFKPTDTNYKCPDPASYLPPCKSTSCEVLDYDDDGYPDVLNCPRDGKIGVENWASPAELLMSFPKMVAATPGEAGAKTALWEDFVICADISKCHGCGHSPMTDDYICSAEGTMHSVILKLNLTNPCPPEDGKGGEGGSDGGGGDEYYAEE